MEIHLWLNPLISLVAGIVVLIFPAIVNYVIAIYLILAGVFGLIGQM